MVENRRNPLLNRGLAVFGLSVAAGVAAWLFSPQLFGELEPWDTEGLSYYAYLLVVSLVAGVLVPPLFWVCPIGIGFGQLIGMSFIPEWGPLAALGILVFLPLMSLLSLVGASVGAAVGYIARKSLARWLRSRHKYNSPI